MGTNEHAGSEPGSRRSADADDRRAAQCDSSGSSAYFHAYPSFTVITTVQKTRMTFASLAHFLWQALKISHDDNSPMVSGLASLIRVSGGLLPIELDFTQLLTIVTAVRANR